MSCLLTPMPSDVLKSLFVVIISRHEIYVRFHNCRMACITNQPSSETSSQASSQSINHPIKQQKTKPTD